MSSSGGLAPRIGVDFGPTSGWESWLFVGEVGFAVAGVVKEGRLVVNDVAAMSFGVLRSLNGHERSEG